MHWSGYHRVHAYIFTYAVELLKHYRNSMFMYTASDVYGKDLKMRHNSQAKNLTNNNNGISSNTSNLNDQQVPFCNVDNAVNYYKNVNLIGSTWSMKGSSRSSNASPSKCGRQICRQPPGYSAVPSSELLQYSNSYAMSYAPQRVSGASTGGNNNHHAYQQMRQSVDYYSGTPQHKVRQHSHSNSAHANQEIKYSSPLSLEKDKLKRQIRIRSTSDFLDGGLIYSHNRKPTTLETSWSSVIPGRPLRFHSTDQHYEHYFSYFYNRGGRDQLPKNHPPHTSHSVCNYKPQMSLLHEPSSKRSSNASRRNNIPNDNNQNVEYDSYILKENNELPFGYNDSNWNDSPENDCPEKCVSKANDDDYISNNDAYDSKEINVEQFDPTLLSHRRFVQHSEINELNTTGDSLTVNNNISQAKKTHKVAISPHIAPRLPLTPKRIRGGQATVKKILPTVHRVLLYNSQSPRLARHSHGQCHAQGDDDHITKYILDDSEEKANEYPEVDFDNDDDLDNISNFDESDTVSVSSDTEDGYRAHAYKMAHSGERLSSSPKNSKTLLFSQTSDEDLCNPKSVLVPSLFPFVPPYLSFSSNTQKGPDVPADLHRVLKWRVTNIMPKVVRLILANSGMRMLKKTNDWMGVWGKHLKSPCFKTIRSYQKINHLPGSFRIGRKDSCWKNLQRQMKKHSNREFGFMPRTYVIPNDLCALRKRWPKYAQRNTKWIIKPPASARGAGIRVVNRWGQIPKRRPLIVQKYIERPLLINGSKFDLRLYVLVTSVNPLRVFMYHNGLARFASVKYSAKIDTLNDRCMHLTNYSINKFSSNYSKNEDVNACHGHKWTIKSLWNYLANRGVRTDGLWEALRSLVLRTILAGENGINSMIRANVESKYSCFELFGFDVILDSDLVPWLLEVNISPSLHSELPLDAHVKAPLVQGVLNTALYNIPPKLTQEKQKELAAEFSFPPGTQMCYDKRLYINYLSRDEKVKHNNFTRKTMENREDYVNAILQKLTPDDVRCLIVAEDELARCAPLERIFPTDQTHKYLKYNDTPRYYNRLLDAWESRYANNRTEGIALLRDYCQAKYHLQVPVPPAKKDLNDNPEENTLLKLENGPIANSHS
ncbi:tubulin monoglutamylase TTLL4 isoform X3 [Drosophila nasuta]|uniref:tubulin monoglutamylase TTLL4 isoform X3 n=1 Tax=Drosophila nasuta TaxID=42062 RepID=UPI00295E49FB|nr:tubulin monoglutamylase TTLL4 isoform X3 [Drosophila nasuta]